MLLAKIPFLYRHYKHETMHVSFLSVHLIFSVIISFNHRLKSLVHRMFDNMINLAMNNWHFPYQVGYSKNKVSYVSVRLNILKPVPMKMIPIQLWMMLNIGLWLKYSIKMVNGYHSMPMIYKWNLFVSIHLYGKHCEKKIMNMLLDFVYQMFMVFINLLSIINVLAIQIFIHQHRFLYVHYSIHNMNVSLYQHIHIILAPFQWCSVFFYLVLYFFISVNQQWKLSQISRWFDDKNNRLNTNTHTQIQAWYL